MIEIALHRRVALLIDADNVRTNIDRVLEFSSYFGSISVRRAYGDWRKKDLKPHIQTLDVLNVERVQVDDIGQESTDRWLLLELGKLLADDISEPRIDTLIIVSGDGGFASACQYVKENGRELVAVGSKSNTSQKAYFLDLCQPLYFVEDLDQELELLKQRYPIPPDEVRAFHWSLIEAYHQCTGSSNDYRWIAFSQLGSMLREVRSDYETRYGKYPLSMWLANYKRDFLTQDQMIRRIDANPELARRNHLITAYHKTKDDKGLAPLSVFGTKLREVARDYEEQFGEKRLSEWIQDYPDDFEIRDGFVIRVDKFFR